MSLKKENNQKEKKKTNIKKVDENTTRIRIDDDRINDFESLDVSFIEGKIKKTNKEKILKEKKDYSIFYSILKFIVLLLVLSVLVVFSYMYVRDNHLLDNLFKVEKKEVKEEKKKDDVIKMDYNYLFIGDYHTDGLEFDEFYKPYVKISNEDFTTSDILDDLRDYIYVYNPSHVFIQLGINDFKTNTSISEVVDNLRNIVRGIQNNRSRAIIYVESLYPVNLDDSDINNDFIVDINNEILTMCKSLDVNYIDMYNELSENDLLKEEYSDDGIKLNSDGYKKVFKVINRYIDE